MSEKIEFNGTDLFLQPFRTNKDSFRVTIDIGRNEYWKVKNIPLLPQDRMYKITVEEVEKG